jgi:DNA-binding response OmpR family regulator
VLSSAWKQDDAHVPECRVKVLVVEDEAPMATALKRGLGDEGFAVDVATNAQAAKRAVSVYEYDAIILDVRLPGGDGFALCRQWREEGLTTPIIFLTACDDVSDRVRGLDLGGDDYLVKPFAFEELLARVRALVRRGPAAQPSPELRVADLVIDTARRRVTRGTRVVPLTAREYQILEFLARNAGRVVTRTSLWEHVWESDDVPDSNVVDVYVRYLRNKLRRDPDLIRTVRGGGYVLEAPDPATDDAAG